MQVCVTEECIQKANAPFWEQMLAMRLDPVAPIFAGSHIVAGSGFVDAIQARCIGPDHLVGSCDLAGVWVGRIEVRLSRGLALEATSVMLMQPVESVEASDTLDATKEIANMIAGSIKSSLPRPCTMTVPSAKVESEDFCVTAGTRNSVTAFFHHTAGELMIRVWQAMPESEADFASEGRSHAARMFESALAY